MLWAKAFATILTGVATCLSPVGVLWAQESSAAEFYGRIVLSVITLGVEGRDGTTRIATGFLAVGPGLAVTSWHVLKAAKRVVARFSDGAECDVSGLVDKDEARDIAIIRVKVLGRPLLPLGTTDPPVGSRAYVVGAPHGLEFTITEGLISQRRLVDTTKQLQFSCAVSPGNSGSPLLVNGEVVGVVSWQFREGQNLNFAVAGGHVMALDSTLPTQPWETVVSSGPSQRLPTAQLGAQDVLSRAATIFVRQTQGNPELFATVERELLRWKKYSVVDRPEAADLILDLSPTADVNLWAGKGAKAVAVLTSRDGLRLWSTVKGGDWSMAGYTFPKVAKAIVDDLRRYVMRGK